MSRALSAHRRGVDVVLAGLIALTLAAIAALSLAPAANAAFTTGKCAGDSITGRGASFARDAHTIFNQNFKGLYCIGTPGFNAINVDYEALGSGAGLTAVKSRTDTPRFGMSDDPPSPDEVAQINAGTTNPAAPNTNPNDDGRIHVVPAAVGAVAPLVNFPDGCDPDTLSTDPAGPRTDHVGANAANTNLTRVRFTKQQFEDVWAKEANADTWREVFPDLANTPECNKPIIRVVRFDQSGTTFAFKDYLNTIDGAEGWLDAWVTGAGGNRAWPGATYGPRLDCPLVPVGNPPVPTAPSGPGADSADPNVPGADQLTSGCSNGNGAVVTKLNSTDGSVGYSDISTARPTLAVNPAGGDDPDKYWTQIPNGSGQFAEPTASPDGFRTTGSPGSNCQAANFSNVPATTLDNWGQVSGVDALQGYGICTFTYGLVFDDNADVWGTGPGEEPKARTVKDYWMAILSDSAQGGLFAKDYAPLPADILARARAGIAEVDWNKGAGGGGGGGGGGGTTTTPTPGGPSTPSPPAAKPSNQFSVPKTAISSKTGNATVSVKLPGAGRLELLGNAKSGKKTIKVGRVVLTANRAGTFKLTLKPGKAAKELLRKKGKLKVSLKLTFTPTGGTAKSSTRSVTLKLAKPKKKSERR
jgi:ABC-type phosphate transport system substrate-binding protein